MVRTENSSPDGNRNAAMVPARMDVVAVAGDGPLRLPRGAGAEAVGADDRGPGDELGDGGQQLGVALTHLAVRADEVALHDP